MVLDTNDETIAQNMERKKQDLIKEKLDNRTYTACDIVLVRATDHLPSDGVVNAICNVPFVCKLNDATHDVALNYILKLQEQIKDLDFEKSMQVIHSLTEKSREYSPFSTQYRSSIHFCLNGIVSSHMQGNFDDNPFVIIEPFSAHENDSNILSVRGEDTYFKDKVQLSDEAIILVEESYLDKLIEQNMNPNTKIVPYRGDRDKALEWVLIGMMNIVPEIIGKDYIIESETSKMITDFIDTKGYPCDKHVYSKSYKEDDEKTLILWQKYAKDFYTYLFSQLGDVKSYEGIIDKLSKNISSGNEEATKILEEIIKSIGVDNYLNIISEYNKAIEERISLGVYPTNNEILNGASFGISAVNKSK